MEIINDLYNKILEITNMENLVIYIFVLILIMIIACIINACKIKKITKKYNAFMKKLGNGTNLETMIKQYIEKVEQVDKKNGEVLQYCDRLDKKILRCIQKVGIVRYNAFEDTGSDLCYAIALLDFEDSGVVINGIYSREGSSTFAKPIEKGSSKYTLSTEEIQAIDMAKRNAGTYFANI